MNQKSGWWQDFRAQARMVAERKRAEGPPRVTRADRWFGVPLALLFAAGGIWQLWVGITEGRFHGNTLGTVLASEEPIVFCFVFLADVLLIVLCVCAMFRFIRGNR